MKDNLIILALLGTVSTGVLILIQMNEDSQPKPSSRSDRQCQVLLVTSRGYEHDQFCYLSCTTNLHGLTSLETTPIHCDWFGRDIQVLAP